MEMRISTVSAERAAGWLAQPPIESCDGHQHTCGAYVQVDLPAPSQSAGPHTPDDCHPRLNRASGGLTEFLLAPSLDSSHFAAEERYRLWSPSSHSAPAPTWYVVEVWGKVTFLILPFPDPGVPPFQWRQRWRYVVPGFMELYG